MKQFRACIIFALLLFPLSSAADNVVYREAAELTIFGKLMPGKTANPYHRVDTALYKGFSPRENQLVRMASGQGCAFTTDSRSIKIKTKYLHKDRVFNTNCISAHGYDLYIKKDGCWLWAAAGVNEDGEELKLISGMDGKVHECILYFPTYSEVESIQIGVDSGSLLEALPNPFSHRIAIWGSSFTHGSSTSRAGMTYPAQFSRMTGLQLLSLGCSGRCKLQDYFCDVLCDVEADAFIFDSFSNPSAEEIQARLVPFIDRMVRAHPGKPLIFQQTIRRESRNFSRVAEKKEAARMTTSTRIIDSLKNSPDGKTKYKDLYLIYPCATTPTNEGTVDGVHPDNYGYTQWAKSIRKPVLAILKQYGIEPYDAAPQSCVRAPGEKNIAIVAHRGFWKCEQASDCQNSIASLHEAQKFNLWGSECDVQLTGDGKVIVNHDPAIDGYVISGTPFATLHQMMLKNGEQRPSLESYAAQARKCKTTRLIVELKRQKTPEMEDRLVDETIRILKEQGMFSRKRVVFISFSLHICQRIAGLAAGFTNQYLNGDLTPAQVHDAGINGIDYHFSVLSAHPEWVEQAHKLGMSVNTWTVNDPDQMRQAIGWGVDAITTNEPLLLRSLL